jgi:predicted RNase H-like HicB family nuclease
MKQQTIKTFTVMFQPSQDGGVIASVPDLPGCVSQGDTMDEAQENIAQAIDHYFDVTGEELPALD